MGMTIDKAIEYNKNLKMYMEINDEHDEYKFLEENHIALEMAINTMRKYQKIEEIMNELNGDFYGSYLKDRQALEKIYEVLEDGNDR